MVRWEGDSYLGMGNEQLRQATLLSLLQFRSGQNHGLHSPI